MPSSNVAPDLVVIDSIQAVAVGPAILGERRATGVPGSVTQVRECADQLIGMAKSRQVATVLVGHVTKDGSLAGPRTLEHMVDTVLSFEGDRHHALRLLLAVKHRFGPTGELGLFEMGDQGLNTVDDRGASSSGTVPRAHPVASPCPPCRGGAHWWSNYRPWSAPRPSPSPSGRPWASTADG